LIFGERCIHTFEETESTSLVRVVLLTSMANETLRVREVEQGAAKVKVLLIERSCLFVKQSLADVKEAIVHRLVVNLVYREGSSDLRVLLGKARYLVW